jgi:hypothetical protein
VLTGDAQAASTELEVAANSDRAEAERMQAFEALLKVARIPSLSAVAQNPDANVRERWVAIRALGRIGGAPVRDSLATLLNASVPALRAAAAGAIADAQLRGMAPRVAELLNDPAIIVRSAASDALGIMQDDAVVGHLLEALEDPSNTYRGQSLWVRRHYVQALGQIGSKNALGGLIRALRDEDPTVRDAALEAVERIVGRSYAEGRSRTEQNEAWERWWANQQPRR